MCLICVDLQREKMTTRDARRALGEMVEIIGPEHAKEVKEKIKEAEEAAKQGAKLGASTGTTAQKP